MLAAVIFVLGLIVGSFLNVCIYRLPRSESIISPPSHCPHCRKSIPWFYNIPLLSYIYLKGHCHFCKKPISFRYFAVELITALLFIFLFNHFGLTVIFVIMSLLTTGLIVATFIDWQYGLIPDLITLSGLAIGLLVSFAFPHLQRTQIHLVGLGESFLGILVGGGTIYALGVLGKVIFKKESMGGGDVKLLAMIGAFVGWEKVLVIFFVAPIFGSLVGIILKLKEKREYIPYGPFLSLAAVISILWGDKIIRWLLISLA